MIKRLAVTGATLAAIALTACAAAQPAHATAKPWGLWQIDNHLDYSLNGVTPTYGIQYYGWFEQPQVAEMNAAHAAGETPFLEMQTCGNPCTSATGVHLPNVAAGQYDSYLTQFANTLAGLGYPVLVTFDHEMNGGWYSWGYNGSDGDTPAQWIAAWRHVEHLVTGIAPNARFVFVPNCETTGIAGFDQYYPGRRYVNAVGLDGYITGNSSSYSTEFAPSVADLKSLGGGYSHFYVAETGIDNTDSTYLSQIDGLVSGADSAGARGIFWFDKDGLHPWSFTTAGASRFLSDLQAGGA